MAAKNSCKQCHPHIHTKLSLTEIGCPWIRVHFNTGWWERRRRRGRGRWKMKSLIVYKKTTTHE